VVITWIEAAAGAVVGAGSGAYAASAVRGSYLRHNLATAILAGLGCALGISLALRVHPALFAAACLVLLAVAIPLAAIDVATRTLPDRLLLPAIPACVALLATAAGYESEYRSLWRAMAAGAVVFAAFTLLALCVPGGLGFGDCKAAALCALPLGYLGWGRVLLGVLLAYVLAAIYVVVVRTTRSGRSSILPFGPFLFAGCLVTVLVTGY
jgi:leader peptidase (prepilin peptidase) / N-methyltransferase